MLNIWELLLPPPKKEVMFFVRSVCLSVCPSDYSQTCERILTKFFGGVGHGSRTKWHNFGGDPDHASDPGVQSPKSGSSGSAEVCALWVLLVCNAKVFSTDISKQKGKFFSHLNSILSVTGSGRHEMSSVKLINSHCLPTLLYGCETWCIKQTASYKLNVIWNNVPRKIFNCCWRESARPLLHYCKSMSISHIIDQRRILFWHKLRASSHVLLQLLASLSINEHIAVCSQYGMSAAKVSTHFVKCSVWSMFEQSVLSDFSL